MFLVALHNHWSGWNIKSHKIMSVTKIKNVVGGKYQHRVIIITFWLSCSWSTLLSPALTCQTRSRIYLRLKLPILAQHFLINYQNTDRVLKLWLWPLCMCVCNVYMYMHISVYMYRAGIIRRSQTDKLVPANQFLNFFFIS